jgi:hypothetical protein
MAFLEPPATWVEEEERRRIFWTVFLMDRFCSVATGFVFPHRNAILLDWRLESSWNPSLTTADVSRRLPCEGTLWAEGNPVETPYFGLTDRNSLVNTKATQPLLPEREPSDLDTIKNIGGFAFCVEAMEGLSLVTQFFLNSNIDDMSSSELQRWMMRFKELDLRLLRWDAFHRFAIRQLTGFNVRWKDSLPERWRSPMSLNRDGYMDPNLTLAHLTHNTAIIQLHQFFAYPGPSVRPLLAAIPSAPSADACFQAASEICNLSCDYIKLNAGIINPQFSYCLFIAGRALLGMFSKTIVSSHHLWQKIAHASWQYNAFSADVDTAIWCLEIVAERWNGARGSNSNLSGDNLASKFAARLRQAQKRFRSSQSNRENDPPVDIQEPAYAGEDDPRTTASTEGSTDPTSQPLLGLNTQYSYQLSSGDDPSLSQLYDGFTPDSITMAFPPLPAVFSNDLGSFPENDIDEQYNGPEPAADRLALAWSGNEAGSD